MGADDYLTKDISLPNLLARISAIFRRISAHQNNDNENDFVKNSNLILDLKRYAVSWRNTAIDLTITEFWLLYSMAKYPGHVKSRDQLMEDAKMVVDDSTITTHIKRIRRKFENIDSEFDNIETVYAAGYRWKS
jgi:two-component system OmpR family response regulator